MSLPGGVVDGPSLWRLLIEGRDAVTEVPADRWDPAVYATTRAGVPGKSISRWGGFLDRLDLLLLDEVYSGVGVAPDEVAYGADWQRLSEGLAGAGRLPGLWSQLGERASIGGEGPAAARGAIVAANPQDRHELASTLVCGTAARVLGASAGALQVDQPLTELGLDSLMGMELLLELERDLGVSIPVFALSRDVTIDSLAGRLVQLVADDDGGGSSDSSRSADSSASAPPLPGSAAPRVVWMSGVRSALATFFVEQFGILDQELALFRGGALDRLPHEAEELAAAMMVDATDHRARMVDWLHTRGYLADRASSPKADMYICRLAAHLRLLALDRPLDRISAPSILWSASEGILAPRRRDREANQRRHPE